MTSPSTHSTCQKDDRGDGPVLHLFAGRQRHGWGSFPCRPSPSAGRFARRPRPQGWRALAAWRRGGVDRLGHQKGDEPCAASWCCGTWATRRWPPDGGEDLASRARRDRGAPPARRAGGDGPLPPVDHRPRGRPTADLSGAATSWWPTARSTTTPTCARSWARPASRPRRTARRSCTCSARARCAGSTGWTGCSPSFWPPGAGAGRARPLGIKPLYVATAGRGDRLRLGTQGLRRDGPDGDPRRSRPAAWWTAATARAGGIG